MITGPPYLHLKAEPGHLWQGQVAGGVAELAGYSLHGDG
jgi:hypothetical protein